MLIDEFFFSSRRRHTRSYGDWSSDVCSSDLRLQDDAMADAATTGHRILHELDVRVLRLQGLEHGIGSLALAAGRPPVEDFQLALFGLCHPPAALRPGPISGNAGDQGGDDHAAHDLGA